MGDFTLPVVFITANVGSLFEDLGSKEEIWTEQLLRTISALDPGFVALHFQECGGKLADENGAHSVKNFIRRFFNNDEINRRFQIRCAWMDQDFKNEQKYTALGCIYLIKESITSLSIWNFKESKFESIQGEHISVGDLLEVSVLEKIKFPKEFFPQFKWSRKGYTRTRWKVNNSVFDLLNIHLFHDASNLEAIETSPSEYCKNRKRALSHVIDNLNNGQLPRVPVVLFGDFNFRLDTKSVVESLCAGLHSQHIRKDGENQPSKIIYRDKKSSDKIVLTLEQRKFIVQDQSYFLSDNGKRFQKYNKEQNDFKEELFEYSIAFPPTYPFSDDVKEGTAYNNSRCPSWCDRVLLSHSFLNLVKEDENAVYDLIGKTVCMGDHKPVYLDLRLDTSKSEFQGSS